MKYAVRNISLVLLIISATIPALYAYQAAAAPSEEHVYVMTNNPNKDEILAFERNSVGRLHSTGRYETGGRGSGGTTDPLGSQGSLTLSQDHHLLLAVNAGSGTVSSFYITDDKLHLVDQQPTDGAEPVAVAQHGGFVYVLDQGETAPSPFSALIPMATSRRSRNPRFFSRPRMPARDRSQ